MPYCASAGGSGAFAPYGQLGRSGFSATFGNPPTGVHLDTGGASAAFSGNFPGFSPRGLGSGGGLSRSSSQGGGIGAVATAAGGADGAGRIPAASGAGNLLLHAEEMLRARGGNQEPAGSVEAAGQLAGAPFARRSADPPVAAEPPDPAARPGRRVRQRRRSRGASAALDDDAASGSEAHTG